MHETATKWPRLAPLMAELMTAEPQRGADLVRQAQAGDEDVYGALAWMESRGYAALRPLASGAYGWVEGRRDWA